MHVPVAVVMLEGVLVSVLLFVRMQMSVSVGMRMRMCMCMCVFVIGFVRMIRRMIMDVSVGVIVVVFGAVRVLDTLRVHAQVLAFVVLVIPKIMRVPVGRRIRVRVRQCRFARVLMHMPMAGMRSPLQQLHQAPPEQ